MPDPVPCAERLLAAVAAQLSGLTLDGMPVAVERERMEPLTDRDLPRLVLWDDGSACDQTLIGGTDVHVLTLAIVGHVRGAVDPAGADRRAARDGAADAMRRRAATLKALVQRRLFAGGPFTGAASDLARAEEIRPAGGPPPDRLALFQADPTAAFTLLAEIEWESPTGDPFAFFA